MMKKYVLYFFLIISLTLSELTYAQTLSGIVNRYYPVTAFTAASGGTCSSPSTLASVTVGSPVGAATPASLAAGMEVLIIQMEAGSSGVIDRTTNSSSYGDYTNMGGAGNYEFATIASVSGSTITFTTQLTNTYDVTGKVQLIPTWLGNTSSTNYTTSGTITPYSYDRTLGLGGVIVISTTGTLTLSNDINADASGFLQGDTIGNTASTNYIQTACCVSLVTGGGAQMDATNSALYAFPIVLSEARSGTVCPTVGNRITKGARKGYGIFGRFSGEELSKGKVANGGGGGHGYNSGGGGGGGYQGGGKGGNELAWACNSGVTQPAGLTNGGLGGLGLQGGTTAILMGGGGGAGQGDGNASYALEAAVTIGSYNLANGTSWRGPGSGGRGGGIVIINASQITASGSRIISANGDHGVWSNQDGAGGGGGGGTIVLQVPTYSGTLAVNANGGDGGYSMQGSGDCHGTAGGGGGGRVTLSVGSTPAGVTISTAGGGAGQLLERYASAGKNLLKLKTSFCGSDIYWGAGPGTTGATTLSYTIPGGCPSTTPVTLLIFFAEAVNDNKVRVYWETATEINSSHFIVERSADGVNFQQAGIVQAHGNSQQIINYSFTDTEVSNFSGTVYYRLRMVDIDETFEYSRVAGVVLKGSVISIYPNPVKGTGGLNVTYFSYVEDEEITINIVNILGQNQYSQDVNLVKGSNEVHLSTQGLSAGIYFVEVNGKYGKIAQKIIIE